VFHLAFAERGARRSKYNVPVRQSRHKELNDYIANAGQPRVTVVLPASAHARGAVAADVLARSRASATRGKTVLDVKKWMDRGVVEKVVVSIESAQVAVAPYLLAQRAPGAAAMARRAMAAAPSSSSLCPFRPQQGQLPHKRPQN